MTSTMFDYVSTSSFDAELRRMVRRMEDERIDVLVRELHDDDPAFGVAAAVLVADFRRRRAEDDLARAAVRRFWRLCAETPR